MGVGLGHSPPPPFVECILPRSAPVTTDSRAVYRHHEMEMQIQLELGWKMQADTIK